MATGNKLEVGIGADITDFQKKVKEVESDIRDLSKIKLDQLKLGLDTKEINAQIKDAKNSLATLKDSFGKTGAVIGGQFTKSTANGSNALMQFSRIAQDAPYGIIGIGNNLTATAEAFSHLKNQTGTTGGALKALASSLMGSGGILLGISLLTTGFTLLSQSGLSVSDVIDKVTGDFDSLSQSFKTVSEEANKSAAEQISSLKGLIAIAQDENQTKQRRLEIVNDLQKQFPNYFGNLSAEKIMYGNLTGVVNDLTQALVNKAIAEKFSTVTADSTVKLWKANAKLVKGKEELTKAENDYNNAASDPEKSQSMQFYASAVKRSSDNVKEARAEVLKFNAEVIRGQNIINMASKKASGVIAQPLPKEKTNKPEKTFNIPKGVGIENNLIPVGLKIPPIDTTAITTSFQGVKQTISDEMLSTMELLMNFSTDVESLVTGSLQSTFSNLGTAIGEALATGGNVFQAIGNSLLQSLGAFLSDMGDLLIKYGTLAIVKGNLDLAIATGGPISIGAGIAAIAVGIALKAASGAIGAKAKGGSSGSTSTSTGAGANTRTSSSSGGSSFSNGGTVVFEISGQSLIGVLSNTLDKNKRLGGSLAL